MKAVVYGSEVAETLNGSPLGAIEGFFTYLYGKVDLIVQRGGSRVGDKQLSDVICQPVQESVSERLQRPPTASGHNSEVNGEVHDTLLPLP